MHQGKLDVVKQEMARLNTDILGITDKTDKKLKKMRTSKFNSDDHYIYYCGQKSHWRNGVVLIINKKIWNAVLKCNLKKWQNDLCSFSRKTTYQTVIKDYAPTTNAKEQEADQFYEDLQHLLKLIPK